MLNNEKTCKLVVHSKSCQHDISQMSFIITEQITSFRTPLHSDQILPIGSEKPIGSQNCSHLICMALTKGVNFSPKTVFLTTTN